MATYIYNIRFKNDLGHYEDNILEANNRDDLIFNLKKILEEILDKKDPDYIAEVSKKSSSGEFILYNWQKSLKRKLFGLEGYIKQNDKLIKEYGGISNEDI